VRWLPRKLRRNGQAARLAAARKQAAAAAREVEVSRRRAEAVRKHVNEPRFRAAAENGWAEIIRATIMGDGGGRQRHEPG